MVPYGARPHLWASLLCPVLQCCYLHPGLESLSHLLDIHEPHRGHTHSWNWASPRSFSLVYRGYPASSSAFCNSILFFQSLKLSLTCRNTWCLYCHPLMSYSNEHNLLFNKIWGSKFKCLLVFLFSGILLVLFVSCSVLKYSYSFFYILFLITFTPHWQITIMYV